MAPNPEPKGLFPFPARGKGVEMNFTSDEGFCQRAKCRRINKKRKYVRYRYYP